MNRRFRLSRSTDFKRVRADGKSYTHPLIVLVVMPNNQDNIRVGVTAARSVGKAVQRNRAKRILRAAIYPLLPGILPGHDLILIARSPLVMAKFPQAQAALLSVLGKAKLVNKADGS